MTGAARLHWPERGRSVDSELEAAPAFASAGRVWAEWIARMHSDAEDAAFDALNDLGLGPLVVAVSSADDDEQDDDVQWASSDRLLAAAQSAHELLITKDGRLAPVFAVYARVAGAASSEAARQAMAQDLLDVAAMAQWAVASGKSYVAMDVDW